MRLIFRYVIMCDYSDGRLPVGSLGGTPFISSENVRVGDDVSVSSTSRTRIKLKYVHQSYSTGLPVNDYGRLVAELHRSVKTCLNNTNDF